MKKILCLILGLTIIFTFSACGQTHKDIALAEAGYTCNAEIKYGDDFSCNAFLKIIGGGLFSVTIKTPEELDGLTFDFDNEKMTVSYGGLNSEELNIPESYEGFAQLLNGVFIKLSTGSPTAEYKSDNNYKYEGQSNLYKFNVTVNESGFPTSLSIPEVKLSATFNGWIY